MVKVTAENVMSIVLAWAESKQYPSPLEVWNHIRNTCDLLDMSLMEAMGGEDDDELIQRIEEHIEEYPVPITNVFDLFHILAPGKIEELLRETGVCPAFHEMTVQHNTEWSVYVRFMYSDELEYDKHPDSHQWYDYEIEEEGWISRRGIHGKDAKQHGLYDAYYAALLLVKIDCVNGQVKV